MPKLKYKVPAYRLHKVSDQAVVTLNGRDIYLGRHNSRESRENYQRTLSEWLTNHHVRPSSEPRRHDVPSQADLTINEIFLTYWKFVPEYYRKYGKATSEVSSIRRALMPLLSLYGSQPVRTFGPLSLKTYRQKLIDEGLSRGVVNNHVGRAKRFFKWAVENELAPASVFHALQTVSGLRRGRTAAPEGQAVKPVPDAHVDAVLPQVNRHVAALIQLQRLTGMRPGEVTIMRGRDLDTTGRVWTYRPRTHKTEHHDRDRLIYLGPRAQEIIKPFLVGDVNSYLFSPRCAMEERRAQVRAESKARLKPSQRKRRRRRKPLRRPGEYYSVGSYEHAINRGCERAFPAPGGSQR